MVAATKKTKPWGCLLTSFAHVLGMTDEQLIACLGHDGSEVYWPDLAEPGNRRGFHVQELIKLCRHYRIRVTPIELFPNLRHPTKADQVRCIYREQDAVAAFQDVIHSTEGVLVGQGASWAHAVHYMGGLVTDSDGGEQYSYNLVHCMMRNFYPHTAYVCETIND